jgi:hypothetical protein
MPKAFSVVATNFATYPGRQWSPIQRRVELYSLIIHSFSQQRAYSGSPARSKKRANVHCTAQEESSSCELVEPTRNFALVI